MTDPDIAAVRLALPKEADSGDIFTWDNLDEGYAALARVEARLEAAKEAGALDRPRVTTQAEAWDMADWLSQEAYRLGRAGDGAHLDTMLEAIRYEIRALAGKDGGVTAPSSRPDTTAREHADTVREALHLLGPDGCELVAEHEEQLTADAALDALLAEVERLERERDEAREANRLLHGEWQAEGDRADAAEALAERRGAAISELLDDVGVVFADERLSYIEVQISPDALDKLRAALAGGGQENPAP